MMNTNWRSARPRVAIIGAGVAGLTCAQRLLRGGINPTIIEKSRGLGGRMATRRHASGLVFDHGVQYFTARSPAFRELIDDAVDLDIADLWRPRLRGQEYPVTEDWFVGAPTMNAWLKPAAAAIDIRLDREVTEISRFGRGWRIGYADGSDDAYDVIICTAPAPQAGALLRDEPEIAARIENAVLAPCWALMIAFESLFDPGFDADRIKDGALAWMARNGSKPARPDAPDCWVVHAGPDWSADALEHDPEQIAPTLIKMMREAAGHALPPIIHARAHRWRYALTKTPLGVSHLTSDDRTLFVGGDWCLGGRVEYAFESGNAMGGALLEVLTS